MITKVYGIIDDQDLNFVYNNTTERWVTTAPAGLSGKYTLELWAENDIGTEAYYTKTACFLSPSDMCIRASIPICTATLLDKSASASLLSASCSRMQ